MRIKFIVGLIVLVFGSVWGQNGKMILTTQDSDSVSWQYILVDSVTQDSLDKVCLERGHILEQGWVTLMYCSPRYIDLADRTLRIEHDRNIIRGTCRRCGRYVSELVQAKPDTTIIWKR